MPNTIQPEDKELLERKVIDWLDGCYVDRGAYQHWEVRPDQVQPLLTLIHKERIKAAIEELRLGAIEYDGDDPLNILGYTYVIARIAELEAQLKRNEGEV